jgi:NAD(P)-dependent dehydrogenase (short-subunit alcohol dehydrogenase family)
MTRSGRSRIRPGRPTTAASQGKTHPHCASTSQSEAMRVQELFDLGGKVAVVTGGATGLGRQMARALAEAGADLVVCARNAERCEQAAAELSQLGVRALGLRCDVRQPAEIEEVVARARDELGRLDILVNNSGTAWGAWPEDVPLEGWQKVIDVNLTGAFLFAQAVGRVLIEQGEGGKIVNVSSIVAFRGVVPEAMNAIPYNASKGGLVALTIDLAVKWARHRINVNAIAPGWFPTGLSAQTLDEAGDLLLARVPLGRFGGPDDLKGAVVFLASAASDYVTGQTLAVDGGQLAS